MANKVETAERVLRDILIEEGGLTDEEIISTSTLEDLGFDSLDVEEIRMELEERLLDGDVIEQGDIECSTTVQQILGLIDRMKA